MILCARHEGDAWRFYQSSRDRSVPLWFRDRKQDQGEIHYIPFENKPLQCIYISVSHDFFSRWRWNCRSRTICFLAPSISINNLACHYFGDTLSSYFYQQTDTFFSFTWFVFALELPKINKQECNFQREKCLLFILSLCGSTTFW